MKKTPRKSLILLACFGLSAALMTAVFALCGAAPFGARSLTTQDMSNQYLAFLASLRDVLAGKYGLFYLPGMALGGNMSGLVGYYLASPLDLLTCLFPRGALAMGVGLLYILRVGLCGLTMGVYAGERHGWSWRVLFPALAYSFMAYMAVYAVNYIWQDAVILTPLVALGIVRLLREGRCWLYVLALGGALFCCFYTGYMLCIFSVLFFLYELLCQKPDRLWPALGRFALSSLAAGALAAVTLVPVFLSLLGGKAGFDREAFTLTARFPLREMFSKLFVGAFDFSQLDPQGLPNIFCGSVTTALAVLYFADRAVPRRRRALTGCLLGILALSFWVSALDLIWHGFNVPTWENNRYSFLFSFLLAAMADQALAQLREGIRPRQLLLPVAAVGLMALLAFAGKSYSFITWRAGAEGAAVAALTCGGLYLALRPGARRRAAAAVGAALLLIHGADLAANAKGTLDVLMDFSPAAAGWAEYARDKGAAYALADTGDELIRADSPELFAENRCEGMFFGRDGISHYSSNASLKNLDFLKKLGFSRYNDLFVLYGAGTPAAADTLLDVGYVIAQSCPKPYETVGTSGPYTVYKNTGALPAAWTADGGFADPADAGDCFGYIQALYDAAAPEVGQDIFRPAQTGAPAAEGLTVSGSRYTPQEGAGSLTYTVTPAMDGPLYGEIRVEGYPGVLLFVNDAFQGIYATGQNNGSLYLGDYAAGETVAVRLQLPAEAVIHGAAFVTEDAQALDAYRQAMAPGGCPLKKVTGSHFTGSFTTEDGDSLLVLTLPYDRGWYVTLDGQAVQSLEVQDCLMAIPVTAGSHTLDMRYTPPGLLAGCAVTAAAAAVCILAWRLEKKKRNASPA